MMPPSTPRLLMQPMKVRGGRVVVVQKPVLHPLPPHMQSNRQLVLLPYLYPCLSTTVEVMT